jgi:hypothetical protein
MAELPIAQLPIDLRRTNSLQIIGKKKERDKDNYISASQESYLNQHHVSPPGFTSEEEADDIRARFEMEFPGYLAQLEAELGRVLSLEELKLLEYYFFIGRLNPPHPGHFKSIFAMIKEAKQSFDLAQAQSQTRVPFPKIIIFAGSGPSVAKGSEAAKALIILNNPIPFRLKKIIIEKILRIKYDEGFVNDNIIIKEMKSVPDQLYEIIAETIPDNFNENGKIRTLLIVGDKGDDSTKLDYLKGSIGKKIASGEITKTVTYSPRTRPIEAAVAQSGTEPASATRLRLDSLTKNRSEFIKIYLPSYLELISKNPDRVLTEDEKMTIREIIGEIYDAIHQGIHDRMNAELYNNGTLSEDEINAFIAADIDAYIASRGKSVATRAEMSKKGKKKEGGSKRRKTRKRKRKTKRRKSKKHRKTKRRHYR